MAYRPERLRILGQWWVPITWEPGDTFKHEGEDSYGVHEGGKIRVATEHSDPIDTLIHELWHAHSSRVGQDDQEHDDNAARRVTAFIGDLALNNWGALKAFRQEKLRGDK